jgi:hypothetical protein
MQRGEDPAVDVVEADGPNILRSGWRVREQIRRS